MMDGLPRVRSASAEDMPVLLEMYAQARERMHRQGNAEQWTGGYPQREVIAADISRGQCYVIEDARGVCGAFAFIVGADPTYALIEGGRWLSDAPYGTIHRIVSSGRIPGVMALAVEFCAERIANLRIDTHADNAVMRHLIEKLGFVYCGVIYTRGHSPRLAYQRTRA